MIRDYTLASPHPTPMAFAKSYYLHYPKITFGHWPPLFHIMAALWMMLFPATPSSAMALSTLLAICFVMTAALVVARWHGRGWGVATAALLVCSPTVVEQSRMVLADFAGAILCFLAVVCFAEYLHERKRGCGVAFCVLAVAACYTKYNEYLIFGVPPMVFLLTRKLHPRHWAMPAALSAAAVLLAAPFPAIFARNFSAAEPPQGWRNVIVVAGNYGKEIAAGGGWLLIALAVLGTWAALRRPTKGALHRWMIVALAALVVSTFCFHVLTVRDALARYLDPALLCLAVLAIEGLRYLWRQAPRGRMAAAGLLLLLVALNARGAWAMPHKRVYPYDRVAEWLVHNAPPEKRIMLVDSEAKGEGMLIAEILAREPKPTSYVLRATKLLCATDWESTYYQPYFMEVGPLEDYLTRIPIDYLIIDTTRGRRQWEHHRLLRQMVEARPDRWKRQLQLDVEPRCPSCARGEVTVYERTDAPAASHLNLRITVPGMIRRPLMFEFFDK